MKTNWPTKKLGDVCEIYQPKTITSNEITEEGAYKVFGANGVIGYYSKYNHEDAEVLVTCRGATCGTLNMSEPKSWITGNAMVIHPQDEKVLSKSFLFYTLKNSNLSRTITGTGQPQITRNSLAPFQIPLPPLAIQKQIVGRLDKIAEAQKLNDGLIQKADELFQSLLHKELNSTGKDWGVKKLGDKNVVEIIDGDRGKNYPPKNEFQKSGYCLFLNTKNVTQAGFIFNETDFISKERDEKLRKGKLQKNDVVLTTRGTVGNSALYDDSVEFNHIRINSGMVVLRSNIKEIMPKFLWIVLSSKPVLRQFKQILSGTAQPQLPITNLVKIKIPLPPLEAQKHIVAKLSAVQEYKTKLLAQKSKLKELFNSALTKSMKN